MEWHLSEGKGNSINICVAGTLISSFHQPFIHSLRWWGPVPIVQLWRAPSSSDKKCEETAAFRTLYYPRTVNPSSSSWNWSTNAECWSLARNKKYLDMYPQRLNQLPPCPSLPGSGKVILSGWRRWLYSAYSLSVTTSTHLNFQLCSFIWALSGLWLLPLLPLHSMEAGWIMIWCLGTIKSPDFACCGILSCDVMSVEFAFRSPLATCRDERR